MALFSAGKKASGWMAISLQPDRMDVAHVRRRSGGRPEIGTLESYRREKAAADMLSVLRRQHGLGGYRCITALGGGDYQMLQLDAPEVPKEELREAVRWRIKDMIDYPPDAATLDVVAVPSERAGTSRGRSLYVFSARNEVVRSRMELFDRAKIPLAAIDVPELALRNVANLWAVAGRAVALLAIDEGGGMLVIAGGGELYSARRIESTAAQLAEPAGQQSEFERIGLELQRSFDHYDRQFGVLPLSRLMVAAPQAGLMDYLAANLYIPVEAADLASVMDFPGVPELRNASRQAQGLLAIGLALREEDGAA